MITNDYNLIVKWKAWTDLDFGSRDKIFNLNAYLAVFLVLNLEICS